MSHPTDADLLDREVVENNSFTAVTLDLNSLDTANQLQKSILFSVQGMTPRGFAVESLRFKNTGTQTMRYQLAFQQTAGDAGACSALRVKVLRDWTVVQDTELTNVSLNGVLQPNDIDDVVLAIGLDATDAVLQTKSCHFNLAITAKAKDDMIGGVQFTDEEIVQNQISLGSWSTQ